MEGIGVSLLFKGDDCFIQFLYLFFLSEEFVLFLLYLLFFVKDFFENLFIADICSLDFFDVPIPFSLQFLNKHSILPFAFLLAIELIFQLGETFIDSIPEIFQLLFVVIQGRYLLSDLLDCRI